MTSKHMTVWIGFDPREYVAFAVAKASIRQFDRHIPINGVVLSDLQARGLYTRPTRRKFGKLWDDISGNYMSTEFALSRFLVPEIIRQQTRDFMPGGWALFMDCDVMVRTNLYELKALLDDAKAVYCVKHNHRPMGNVKMDNQEQTTYPRKNWSSVMAFNVDHDSNRKLTSEYVNSVPGLALHGLGWLDDDEIGELPPEWNYLVGHTEGVSDPKIVHFTDGGPWFEAFRNVPYAEEWRAHLTRLAR